MQQGRDLLQTAVVEAPLEVLDVLLAHPAARALAAKAGPPLEVRQRTHTSHI